LFYIRPRDKRDSEITVHIFPTPKLETGTSDIKVNNKTHLFHKSFPPIDSLPLNCSLPWVKMVDVCA